MSGRYDLVKLAEASNRGAVIYLDCRHCRRFRLFFASSIEQPPAYVDRPLRSLPFVCSKCGNRPWRIKVFTPMFARIQ